MVGAQRDYRRVTPIPNSSSSETDITAPIQAPKIRDYTTKEKLKVIAGAVTALVIVGWLVVFALARRIAERDQLLALGHRDRIVELARPTPIANGAILSYRIES